MSYQGQLIFMGTLIALAVFLMSGCTVVMHSEHTELVTEASAVVEVLNGAL